MILVDTHCHLDFPEFNEDRDEVIKRAGDAGVAYIINIGSSVEGSRRSAQLAGEYPMVYASVGIHPHYAKEVNGRIPAELKALVKNKKVVAIGEVGLDYYRNLSPKGLQRRLFLEFLDLAKENNLPVVIHAREAPPHMGRGEAHREVLEILKGRAHAPRGVMHCFSADESYLKECLGLGLYISFTCNLTFKNAEGLRALAKSTPAERLLLETDAPFLAPQEMRGRRNEPAYLTYLRDAHARLRGLSDDDIARITTHNAKALFGLSLEEGPKIAYQIRDSLYLNITNECTNDCDFCIKEATDFVTGHNLRLKREPTIGEIISAVGDPSKYKEIVFCGYGEPMIRLDVVKEVSRNLKKRDARIRMVTNGEGNLIHNRSIVKELAGLIDKFSISLNVDTAESYDKVCRSRFGRGVFNKVKEFAKECRDAGMEVELTFLDLPGVDIKRCEHIAKDELKIGFRMRKLDTVG